MDSNKNELFDLDLKVTTDNLSNDDQGVASFTRTCFCTAQCDGTCVCPVTIR